MQRYVEDGRLEDAARLQNTVTRLKRDIDAFTAEQKEKSRAAAASQAQRNPFLDMDLAHITPQQREDAQKSGLDLNDPQ